VLPTFLYDLHTFPAPLCQSHSCRPPLPLSAPPPKNAADYNTTENGLCAVNPDPDRAGPIPRQHPPSSRPRPAYPHLGGPSLAHGNIGPGTPNPRRKTDLQNRPSVRSDMR